MTEKKTKTKEKETKKKVSKKLSSTDFKKKVLDLAEKGFTSEKIGEELRKEGIHSKEQGEKISKILKEKNVYINPDLKNVEKKLEGIEKHYEANKQDKRAKREKDRIYAKLRKLRKYHKIEIKKK
jgi:ribosomal protein S15P/S13E